MKKIFLSLVFLALLIAGIFFLFIKGKYTNDLYAEADKKEFGTEEGSIENLLDWYLDKYHVPAVSMALIENGKITKYISRGTLSKSDKTKASENTFYQIASTSKMFTGIIAKSLENDSIINVDSKLIDIFPDQLNQEAKEKLKDISLAQIIHHTSGLPRSPYAYSEKDIIESLHTLSLNSTPGTKWEYSNFGYALLTLILEKASKQTYKQLIKKYIIEPYQIEDIVCDRNDVPENALATAYNKHFRLMKNEPIDFGTQIGASGIFTNIKSLAKLLEQQLGKYQNLDALNLQSPLVLTHKKDTMWNRKHFYGYGLFEYNYDIEELGGLMVKNLEHGGDMDGFTCQYELFPEHNCGMVMLTSSGGKWTNYFTNQSTRILVERSLQKDNGQIQ